MNGILQTVSWTFSRSVIFLLLCVGVITQSVNHEIIRQGVLAKISGKMDPKEFGFIYHLSTGSDAADAVKMEEFLYFSRKFTGYFPSDHEGFALMAFCYYFQHNREKAIENFKKAIDLNPQFFWHAYNLGIMYYQKGDLKRSKKYLEYAGSLDAYPTGVSMQHSRFIYKNIFTNFDGGVLDLPLRIEEAKTKIFLLLRVIQSLDSPIAGNESQTQLKKIADSFQIQLF